MDAILSLESNALARCYSGDLSGFAEISDTGISAIDPDMVKPVIGLDAYKAHLHAAEEKLQPQPIEIAHPLVQVLGDSAAVLSYHLLEKASGQRWNMTAVYFCLEGTWKLVHTHRAYLHHQLADSLEIPIPVKPQGCDYPGVLGELMALEAAAMHRWRCGDVWGFIEISDPSVTYFDTGTPRRIDGLEALSAEYATRNGKIFYDASEFIDPQLQICGSAAVLFYRFFSTVLKPDGTIASRLPWNCTEVYGRINDQWKIVHTQWSFIKGQPMRALGH
jgi:hypothetical protein